MDVKAGKSELQSAKKAQVPSSNSARRRTLGSSIIRELNAPSPYTLLVLARDTVLVCVVNEDSSFMNCTFSDGVS